MHPPSAPSADCLPPPCAVCAQPPAIELPPLTPAAQEPTTLCADCLRLLAEEVTDTGCGACRHGGEWIAGMLRRIADSGTTVPVDTLPPAVTHTSGCVTMFRSLHEPSPEVTVDWDGRDHLDDQAW